MESTTGRSRKREVGKGHAVSISRSNKKADVTRAYKEKSRE
jgi:hypothetical protein